MQTKKVEAHELYAFMKELEAAIKQGFQVSDKSEHFPVNWVGYYGATLVKPAAPAKASKA